MKNLLYIFLSLGILFSSCAEEEDPFSPTSSFICKIDGEQLSDSSPSAHIITSNALTEDLEITAASNLPNGRLMNTVTLQIYDFSSVTVNTTIHFGPQGKGNVWKGVPIWQTLQPYHTGTLNFSKISANKVSGTFSFEGYNSDDQTSIIVSEGSFSDVSY